MAADHNISKSKLIVELYEAREKTSRLEHQWTGMKQDNLLPEHFQPKTEVLLDSLLEHVVRTNSPEGVDPRIPIVALTAHALKDEVETFMQNGFIAYLTKPIDAEGLQKTLARLSIL